MQPHYVNIKDSPSPKREYVLDFSNLCGGINLFDPETRLKANESSEMKNLLWRNGMLCSRKGQTYLSSTQLGTGYAAYTRLWHGYVFAHIGSAIYCFHTESGTRTRLCTGIPEIRGTFFLYNNQLYYKTKGAYKVFTAEKSGSGWSFTQETVYPYEPVIIINANPSTGAGDLYQPENRMSARKTVWYNAVSGMRNYYLPVKATRIIKVEVNGEQLTSGWAYDDLLGKVIFDTAPPVTDPPTNNTVRITYELVNQEAMQSILDCRYACVYGGTGELCVVMAGSEDQPNAYFWSGNSSIKMDASYFPIEQVQLASSTEERITGFGKQQDDLVVFKEGSVGKTRIGTQELYGRIFIDMPYIPINAATGYDLPWSIQLVENNLVFANRTGVYMLLDTTPANENNIVCISRKINGSAERPGLLRDIAEGAEDNICSCDDGTHYYLTSNGHTWAWNYELSSWKDPAWFYLTNTNAVALICEAGEIFQIDNRGRLVGLHNQFNDYGSSIERVFCFPTMNFGSYDNRKNVNSVIVTLGAYELENTRLSYLTDYETRADLTNLRIVPLQTGDSSVSSAALPTQSRPQSSAGVGTRPQSDSFPAVFRRRPMCRRVLHFTMKLENNNLNEDLELIGAQVLYNLQGRVR